MFGGLPRIMDERFSAVVEVAVLVLPVLARKLDDWANDGEGA